MESLDITLLDTTYRYATKIEHKFKKKKRDFGSANLKLGKGAPKPQNKGKIKRGETYNNTKNLIRTHRSGGNFIIAPLTIQMSVGPNSH